MSEFTQKVQESIFGPFRSSIWEPFCQAIDRYSLIQEGDRIAVCISGGKDSMLMAKLMQLYQPLSPVPFEVRYLIMDPGYHERNRQKVESNAQLLEIPYTLYESDIFAIANHQEKNPCFLCAKMRRGCLYARAQEMGCNKIALGHHFDDVIETTVMAMFYGAQLQAMPPILDSRNFPGMQLIRPLYMVREEDIIRWAEENGLSFIQCACRFTEEAELHGGEGHLSKRKETKQLLRELRETHPNVEQNIFDAIHHVDLDAVLEWKTQGKRHTFLERES